MIAAFAAPAALSPSLVMIPAFVLLVVVVVLLLPCLPALSPRMIARDKKCELEG